MCIGLHLKCIFALVKIWVKIEFSGRIFKKKKKLIYQI